MSYKTVKKAGYILNFLKYIDRKRNCPFPKMYAEIKGEIEGLRSEREKNRRILRCLNQFEIFRLSEIDNDIEEIITLMNQYFSPHCLADRRFLCYAYEEENDVVDLSTLFAGNDFVTVILTKVNDSLANNPFQLEDLGVRLFRRIAERNSPTGHHLVLRTLANNEVFL